MKRCLFNWLFLGGLLLAIPAGATPSTQIWNPSTDIQAKGAWHFGIDDYFTVEDRTSGGYAFPTDVGLTYGLLPGLEVGIDAMLPQNLPGSGLLFNAKYGFPEGEVLPALALGSYGLGTLPGLTDMNVIYGLAAKTFPLGRISAGYFTGNAATIGADNKGYILTWDKALTDKVWACVDYASGQSTLGATFYGFSWLFAPNTSIIFGYGTYNNGAKPTVTTQLDINI
ncbi:MAG: hypothetical protein WC632_04395 [Candidatus Margulisiibacteriota bacterium]